MSTAAQGISLRDLQAQLSALLAQQGGEPAEETADVPAVQTPKTNGKGKKTAAVAQSASVPVVAGKYNKPQKKAEVRTKLRIIGRMEDGTQITMGVGHGETSDYGFGFRIGEGRVKWGKATFWLTVSALAEGIAKYVSENPLEE